MTLAIVVLAMVLRMAMNQFVGERFPYVTVFVAVAAVGWIYGFGPAVGAMIAGGVAAFLLFLRPGIGVAVTTTEAWWGSALYAAAGTMICLISYAQHRALESARSEATRRRRAEDELRRAVTELRGYRDSLEQLVQERTEELREALVRESRSKGLAELGRMAAGLGHDLANLLMPMAMDLESLRKTGLSPEAQESVESLAAATAYVRRLTAGLRMLAARDAGKLHHDAASGGGRSIVAGSHPAVPAEPARTDLVTWWSEAETVLRVVVPRHVSLRSELPIPGRNGDAPLAAVAIAPARLMQVVFNLVQNAGEAMLSLPRGIVTFRAVSEDGGRRVRIEVRDNGPGMSPEVLARCTEPMYSTKGVMNGPGRGLGLAMVREIIEGAGGTMRIESTPGAGAAFLIDLPAAEEQAAVALPARG